MSRRLSILKQPILSVVNDHLIDYPTPSNLSYWWSFGSLAGLCILLQILAMVFYFAWLNENEWLLGFQNAFIPMIRSIFDMSQDMLFFFTIFFFLLISWMFLRLSLLLYARNCPIPERMARDNFTMGTIAHSSFIQQFFRFIQCSLFLAMSWYYTRPAIYRLGLFIIAWLGFCFLFNYAECAPPKSHPHINIQYGDTAPSVSAPSVSAPPVAEPPVAEPSVSAPPVAEPPVPMPEGIPEIVISQDERQRFVKGIAKLIQDPEIAKLSCKEIASLFVDNFSTMESEPTSSIKPFIETLKDPQGKDVFVSRMCAPRPEVPTEPTVTEGGAGPIISTAQQEKRSWNDWLYELRTNFDPKLAQEGCDLFLETFPHLPNSLAVFGAGGVAYKLATALNTLKPSAPPVAKAALVTGGTLATAFAVLASNQSMLKKKLQYKLEKARIEMAREGAPPEQGVPSRRQRREQEQADTSALDQPNDMGSSGEAVIGRQVSLGNPSPSPNNPPTSSENSLFSKQDWAQDYESWTSWSLSLFDLTGYSLSDFSPIVSSMVFLFFAFRSRSLFHFYLKSTFWWSFSPTLGFNDLSLKGWIFGIIKIPYEAFQTLTKPFDDTGDFSRLVLEQIHILIYLGPYCIFIIFMGLFLILVQGNLARFLRYILSKPWIQNSRLRKSIEFYARLRDWMHKYLTAIGYTLILIGCLEGLICFYLLASYLNLLEQ